MKNQSRQFYGRPGSGKSVAAVFQAWKMVGQRFILLMDNSGDTTDLLLDNLDEHQRKFVVFDDLDDPDCGIGIDLFSNDSTDSQFIAEVEEISESVNPNERPVTEQGEFLNGLQTLFTLARIFPEVGKKHIPEMISKRIAARYWAIDRLKESDLKQDLLTIDQLHPARWLEQYSLASRAWNATIGQPALDLRLHGRGWDLEDAFSEKILWCIKGGSRAVFKFYCDLLVRQILASESRLPKTLIFEEGINHGTFNGAIDSLLTHRKLNTALWLIHQALHPVKERHETMEQGFGIRHFFGQGSHDGAMYCAKQCLTQIDQMKIHHTTYRNRKVGVEQFIRRSETKVGKDENGNPKIHETLAEAERPIEAVEEDHSYQSPSDQLIEIASELLEAKPGFCKTLDNGVITESQFPELFTRTPWQDKNEAYRFSLIRRARKEGAAIYITSSTSPMHGTSDLPWIGERESTTGSNGSKSTPQSPGNFHRWD